MNTYTIITFYKLPINIYANVMKIALFVLSNLLISFFSLSQCTLPSRQYLPNSDQANFNNYAEGLDVFGNHMVVGASYNDSLAFDGGIAYVYFLNSYEKWVKIAELAPSDPQRSLEFGMHVSITENTIGILGNAYDENGIGTTKIYIYERPSSGVWSNSTETYQLTVDHTLEFEFNQNELVVLDYGFNKPATLKIFQKISGLYALHQTIDLPLDSRGQTGNARQLSVEGGIIALGADQFVTTDNKTGVAFVYQRSGGLYGSIPAATLQPSDYTIYDWIGFGINTFIYKNTVFIMASSIYQNSDTFNHGIFIFEKPLSGWTDATVSPQLVADGNFIINAEIIADENFVIVGGYPWSNVEVFKKKTSDWTSAERFEIAPPLPGISFGRHMYLVDRHLIVGSPNLFNRSLGWNEVVVDYFSNDNDWFSITTPNQIITESPLNASGDFFGAEITVNENQLFVGAPRDSELGLASGCVYAFDIHSPENSKPIKLLSPQPQIDSGFGYGLAASDSLLFVSAIFQDSISGNGSQTLFAIGKVFVYKLSESGWIYSTKVLAPEIKPNALFGQDIAYHNGYLAISEFNTFSSESDGRVHIYKENGTGQFRFLATLKPSEDIRGDFFGRSIIMNDSLIVVATGNTEFNTEYQMKVFIYKKKGEWTSATEDASLLSSDKKWKDLFGFSIAMDGDYIVVGAPSAPGFNPAPVPITENSKGAAYVFKRPKGGWKGRINEIAKLLPSDPVDYAFFGTSVGIDHDDIFVGAPHSIFYYNVVDRFVNPSNKILPGKVYHYNKKTEKEWVSTNQEKRQLQSFEPDWLDGYGYKIIISDRYLYSSALLDNTEVGFQSGSVQTVMQLPIIREIDTLCVAGAPVQLKGFPKRNGYWSGVGVDTMTRLFNPLIAGPGNHPIKYEVSGCESMDTISVVDYDLKIISKSPNSQIKCIDSSIEINLQSNIDSSHYTWFYRASDQNLFQKYDSLKTIINPNRAGSYKGEITYKFCPTLVELFDIEDEPPVDIVIDRFPIICSDDPFQLQANPIGGNWSGDGVSQTGLIEPAQEQNGILTVKYTHTSEIGCIAFKETQIVIDKLDEPTITQSDTQVCINSPVTFQLDHVDSKTNIQWYNQLKGTNIPGDGLNLTVTTAGSYYAMATKHNCSRKSPILTIVQKVDSLFVPNVFTPNADASNEYFEIRGKNMDDFTLIILNRYGQRIYETTNPDFTWDAENISSGVYFWRITYMNCEQTGKEFNGWVQIVR